MIRPLTPADAGLAARLIRTAFADTEVPVDPPPSALRVTQADILAHLERGGGGALVHADACVLWSPEPGALYIGRLAVRPGARGRGFAARLLAAAEREAIDSGLFRLRLEVRLGLAGNRRLFRRAGFVEGAHHAHPGFDAPTYLEAEKRLEPPA